MSPPLDEHRARPRECTELVRLIVAKFLEHDVRYQAGGWWWRARRRAEVFTGAWAEILCSDVWTDEAHDAVVCQTPERRKLWPLAPVAGFAALGPFVAMLPGPVQWVLVVMAVVGFISLVPTLRRELRRSKRHRPNAGVLTFLASRRPGAGRALLDARCEAADGRGEAAADVGGGGLRLGTTAPSPWSRSPADCCDEDQVVADGCVVGFLGGARSGSWRTWFKGQDVGTPYPTRLRLRGFSGLLWAASSHLHASRPSGG